MIKYEIRKLFSNQIIKSSFIIVFITALTKILGYFEKLILAHYFGTDYRVDAYNLVFTIVTSIFIFFRELVEPGFLVVFLSCNNVNDKESAWALFNKVFKYILILTSAISVFVFIFPDRTIDLFAPGFEGEKRELSINLLRFAFPATIFFSLSALTNITLNGQKKFALPVFGDFVSKFCLLGVFAFFFPAFGIIAIVWGILLGAVIKLGIHSIGLYKNYSFRSQKVQGKYLKEISRLTWPLFVGITFSQAVGLIDNIFASFLEDGALSALGYSRKLIELPVLIFPYVLSIVIFPYFSESALAKKSEQLTSLLSKSVLSIIVIFIPLSIFFNAYSTELVDIVFKRGAFDAHSALITARPLSIYSYGLVFFALETIVVVFYFSISNTKTPIKIGILCVLENVIITYFLIKSIGYTGIAWGLVISKVTKVTILFYFLFKDKILDWKIIIPISFKVLIASCTLPVVFWGVSKIPFPLNYGKFSTIGMLLTAFSGGMISYLLLLNLIRKPVTQ